MGRRSGRKLRIEVKGESEDTNQGQNTRDLVMTQNNFFNVCFLVLSALIGMDLRPIKDFSFLSFIEC